MPVRSAFETDRQYLLAQNARLRRLLDETVCGYVVYIPRGGSVDYRLRVLTPRSRAPRQFEVPPRKGSDVADVRQHVQLQHNMYSMLNELDTTVARYKAVSLKMHALFHVLRESFPEERMPANALRTMAVVQKEYEETTTRFEGYMATCNFCFRYTSGASK